MKAQEVFNIVANKYDLMNDVMSAGTHRYWKECMIDWLEPFVGMKIVDVAGGTGDVSTRFLKRIDGLGEAVVCDPNSAMIEYGKNAHKKSTREKIHKFFSSYIWGFALYAFQYSKCSCRPLNFL